MKKVYFPDCWREKLNEALYTPLLDVAPPIMTNGNVPYTSAVPLFKTASNDAQNNVPTSTWGVMLNDEKKQSSCKREAAGNDKALVEHKSSHTEIRCTNEDDVITREVNSSVRDLATTDLSTIVRKSLDDSMST